MAIDIDNLAFARKYRPNTLSMYIGNKRIKETALKALASARRPQLIMLWGSSGGGKTSFARLLAKEYSCENRDNEGGACGKCVSCQIIDEYIATGSTDRLTNVQEIDITDQSGKKDLDSVLADMEIPSYGDEWKIYILDECHMASKGLQNRLLKIAEEPPENVLIILCTTNPEDLLETLKNRCQLTLHVEKPKVRELSKLLEYVCKREGVEYDREGVEFIANRSELTIRTALQNLQQVVTEQNCARYANVIKVFDAISSTLLIRFFRALKNRDVFSYITLLYEVKSKFDLGAFVRELESFVQRGVYTINGIVVDGVTEREAAVYKELFSTLGVEQISVLLTKLTRLSKSDVEMGLMMLGYTGFDAPVAAVETVRPVNDEVKGELQNVAKVLRVQEVNQVEQGVANAADIYAGVDMDDILADFGGELVD